MQAAEKPKNSQERLLLVTAYAVSIYSNLVRTTKPFKDLQNSTYELVYPERGYRLLGEKVPCLSLLFRTRRSACHRMAHHCNIRSRFLQCLPETDIRCSRTCKIGISHGLAVPLYTLEFLLVKLPCAALQVTHGPATHVMMCEGRKWRFLAFDESDLQFTLQCYIRIRPVGIMSVTFADGDIYEWTQVGFKSTRCTIVLARRSNQIQGRCLL